MSNLLEGRGSAPGPSLDSGLTMYDDKYFFVNNPLNRYSIGPRQNLKNQP